MIHLLPLRRGRRRGDAPASTAAAFPQLLDRKAAAEAAGVCAETISRGVALYNSSRGQYGLRPAVQRPRMLRIAAADLSAWIAAGMPTGVHQVAARGAGD